MVTVRLAEVRTSPAAAPIRAFGTVADESEIRLSFPNGGIIGKIPVKDGQAVRAGMLLARLKRDDADARVRQMGNAMEKAGIDRDRSTSLFKDGAISKEQLQNANAAYRAAKINLESAALQRKYAAISSPVAGRILKVFASENEFAAPGAPILSMASAEGGLVVKAGLAEHDILRVAPGDSATVILEAYPENAFRTAVSSIAERPDPLTGAWEVEMRIVPGSVRILPGLVAQIAIAPSAKRNLARIPIAALVDADGYRGAVFAPSADGSAARRITVSIAFLDGKEIAIESGLDSTRWIVCEGAAFLSEGASIRVVQ